MRVVHVLKHGYALCGLPSPPSSWPEGHRWVSFEDTRHLGEVTCDSCRRANKSEGKLLSGAERAVLGAPKGSRWT